MVKVYFIGAHSTGKTTMARYVSIKHNLPLLPEVARLVLAEKELSMNSLRHDLNVVDEFQLEIFKRQIKEEKEMKNGFVSDRSFDNLAYAAQHSRILKDVLFNEETKEYVESLRSKEVKLFFVRPNISIMKNDGVRESVDWEEIIRIDAMVKFMLEMWGLKYFAINTNSMQERTKLVDIVLEGALS